MGIFGWSLPPGCGTLPGEEPEPSRLDLLRQANGKRLLRQRGCVTWGELASQVYDSSAYGVTLAGWPISLQLGAIVEGVDATPSTVIIDLSTPWRARFELAAAIDTVEAECEAIWMQTHGCESCARLAGVPHEYGATPVHTDCPSCFGNGIVL